MVRVSPAISVGQVWLGPSTGDPYVVSRTHRDTGLVDMVSAEYGGVTTMFETTVTREWTKLPDVRQGQRWESVAGVVTITAVDLSTMKVYTSAQEEVDLVDWHQAGWELVAADDARVGKRFRWHRSYAGAQQKHDYEFTLTQLRGIACDIVYNDGRTAWCDIEDLEHADPVGPSFFDQVKELAACGEKPKCQIEEYDTPCVMACHFHDVRWISQDQPTCPFAGQRAHTGDHVRILASNVYDFEACYEAEPRDGSALAHLATMGQTVAMVLSAEALRHLATLGKACDGVDGASNPTSERFALLELD